MLNTGRNRDQQIPKLNRRRIPNLGLALTADHRNKPFAPGVFVAVPLDHHRVEALFANAPSQFGKLHLVRIEPCSLACGVAVEALLDVAGPAAVKVRCDPSARA